MNGRYYIVSMKSYRGSLIAIEIAKRKKERARSRRIGGEINSNQANLM